MFEYHPPSEQTLKGFTDTINVYKVIGETNIESRFEARAQGSATALFGRESELAVLSGLWRKARRGQGQVVLVTGQPGIGKSRLALGFVKAFEGAAVSKLNLYSASHLTNRALHPFVRELDRFIGFAHTTEREQRLRGLEAIVEANPAMGPSDIPLLADLVGIDLDGQPHLDPQVRARQTMDALVRRVQGVAEASPLLMVFEDAHWADSATLETLALLIERLADMPAMLIITSRPVFQAS
jgi:predicted ATPase